MTDKEALIAWLERVGVPHKTEHYRAENPHSVTVDESGTPSHPKVLSYYPIEFEFDRAGNFVRLAVWE